MHRLDNLDKTASAGMVVLALWFCWLVATLDVTVKSGMRAEPAEVAITALSSEYVTRLNTAKQLLEGGNLDELGPVLNELIAAYPHQAEPFMLLGDYHFQLQKPISAMHALRQALDLNLDYLEKKSPLYQGEKIKNVVAKAEREIQIGLNADPDDPLMKKNRKEFYYMLRKLAGGCGD